MKCLYLTTVRPSHGILFRRVFLCHHVMSENVSSNSSSIQAQKCCLFHSAKWNHLSVELTTYVECPPIWFVDKIDNVLLLSLARFIDGLKYLRSFFIRENRFYFKKILNDQEKKKSRRRTSRWEFSPSSSPSCYPSVTKRAHNYFTNICLYTSTVFFWLQISTIAE